MVECVIEQVTNRWWQHDSAEKLKSSFGEAPPYVEISVLHLPSLAHTPQKCAPDGAFKNVPHRQKKPMRQGLGDRWAPPANGQAAVPQKSPMNSRRLTR